MLNGWVEKKPVHRNNIISAIAQIISKTLVVAELEVRKLRHDPYDLLIQLQDRKSLHYGCWSLGKFLPAPALFQQGIYLIWSLWLLAFLLKVSCLWQFSLVV